MNNGYILFYDSGIGGLSTLTETLKTISGKRFLYYADDLNCPYGNKTDEEIKDLVTKNIIKIICKYNIDLIVFACNTITACVVENLRERLGTEIIGTEPAVVPALRKSKSKHILVLATNATIRQDKYLKLINAQTGKITSLNMSNLAEKIECQLSKKHVADYSEEFRIIESTLKDNPAIDEIVLGCTHYSFIKEEIKRLGLEVIDGNYGVAKRVAEIAGAGDTNKKNKVKLILSSNDLEKKKSYKKLILSFNKDVIIM